MAGKVKAIPEGYHSVTPYLRIRGASEAIEFYRRALGAVETVRMAMPDGRVGHAELKIGDSTIMLADEFPEMNIRGPQTLGGTSVSFCIYLEDSDSAFKRAVDAGAKVLRPVQDQFYGDRSGTVVDPYGHEWTLSTHKEDLSPEEFKKRTDEALAQATP
jgi:PhnB protein